MATFKFEGTIYVQESERGEAMQENVDSLDDILSELDIADTIEEQIDAIQEVIDR